jgi:hypothetical protein
MPLPDIALIAVAMLFALMGAGALLRPNAVTRQFGMPTLSPAGRTTLRSDFGSSGVAGRTFLHRSASLCSEVERGQ